MDDSAETLTTDPAAERLLADDLRQLVDDGQRLAKAELAYQKSRALYAGKQARGIGLLVLLAAALGFFALMALTVGLVIGLAPLLGILEATGVVAGAMMFIALLSALAALLRWRGMVRVLNEHEAKP